MPRSAPRTTSPDGRNDCGMARRVPRQANLNLCVRQYPRRSPRHVCQGGRHFLPVRLAVPPGTVLFPEDRRLSSRDTLILQGFHRFSPS